MPEYDTSPPVVREAGYAGSGYVTKTTIAALTNSLSETMIDGVVEDMPDSTLNNITPALERNLSELVVKVNAIADALD